MCPPVPDAPGRLIAAAGVGYREVYVALRAERGHVLAVAVQTHWCPKDIYNFGWKEVEEGAGPIIALCPEKILQRLSPVEEIYPAGRAHDNATAWREQCWQEIRARQDRPRLAKGAVVEFPEPLRFADGRHLQRLKVARLKPLRFCHPAADPDSAWPVYQLSRRVVETTPFVIVENGG